MDTAIHWETEMEVALGRAKKNDRPILLMFHNPG